MDALDQVFTCTRCGHQAAYQAEECALFTAYRTSGGKVKAFPVRLVYCPRCGEGYEVPDVPGTRER
jgi:hypothetical protein